MKKPVTRIVMLVVILFAALVAFNVIKGIMIKRFFATFQPPPATVSSVNAVSKTWQPYLPAVGNLIATNGVDVNSQAAGNVVKIHFKSGEYVKEGSPLIDIDDSINQAVLKFNQAQLNLRELNYQRQVDLHKRGASPVSNVDEAKANLDQSLAEVEKTKAEISQKHITAPFSGKLGIRQVNLGQYVTPGQTAIVTLQALDPLYLEFFLPEQLYKKLHIGQGIRFHVEEFPDYWFKGKITALNAKADPNTHNIKVQATVPNCPFSALKNPQPSTAVSIQKDAQTGQMLATCSTSKNEAFRGSQFAFIPGMFAAIEVDLAPIPHVIVLPSTAISYTLYGDSVYVIEKEKEDWVAQRVFVKTGEQRGNETVILSGVKAGQQVVSAGEIKLQNGARVKINNSVQLKPIKDPNALGQ